MKNTKKPTKVTLQGTMKGTQAQVKLLQTKTSIKAGKPDWSW